MKTKPRSSRSPIAILLLGTFLLAWAGTAAARDIVVEYVTVTVASLNIPTPLTGEDTITVRNGGTLWVDANATIKDLIIGDSSSTGGVLFSGTPSILTVTNDVMFGSAVGNALDMAYITPNTGHILRVGRNFLMSGTGSFNPGSAKIEYNGIAAQTVTARIGGSGGTIFYKDVVLSGSPATGNALKTFATGVSIQGVLDITEKAKAQGSSVSYGSLGRLRYLGNAVTSSTAEWPATMTAQVTIGTQVTLDGDKLMGACGAYPSILVVQAGGVLKDGGKTLTVQGNVDNNGSIEGAGKLVLGGSSFQSLTGNGVYGNLTLNNSVGGALPVAGWTPAQPVVRGRLVIQSGKLLLPIGTGHQTSLLTYGGADKAVGGFTTYGATTSFADVRDDTVFNNTGTGTLGVPTKPVAVLAPSGVPPTLVYGTSDATISGTVTAPPGTPDFNDFGNSAVNGEVVTIIIASSPPVTNMATVQNGVFNATFTASGLSVGSSLNVSFTYPGGINLKGSTLDPATTLSVVPKPITIIPANTTKIYNGPGPDPAFPFSYAPPDALVGSDYFTGALARLSGANVGAYDILQGTLVITNNSNPNAGNNYALVFDNSKKLNILAKPVTVTINSTNKIYGDPNPAFTATFFPALIAGDEAKVTGSPETTAGNTSNVASYTITPGTLTAGNNYSQTFVNGNLVINKKEITVAFPDKSKTYADKDSDPLMPNSQLIIAAVNGTVPGLVGSDTFGTSKPSRDAGETVAGGPYLFRMGALSLGNKAGNYNVTYPASGKLTINRRSITVKANNPTRKYGQTLLDLVNYTGFQTSANNPSGVSTQTKPIVEPAITWGAKGAVSQCSLPDTYTYTIAALSDANDPNHSFSPGTPFPNGQYTVNRADLTIRPDNKTKVYDNSTFDYSGFTASYNSFVCSDTIANSLTGFLVYGGPAVSATAPGVYPITQSGLSSPSKYNVIPDTGYLSITTSPNKEDVGDTTWAAGGSRAVMINHPNGQAGQNPGWNLLNVTGNLVINASTGTGNQFRLDLVTLSGNAAGRMPKFDPTREYSWEFARASSGITGFTSSGQFDINWNGLNLFANPVFDGSFSVRQSNKSLFLDYTPVGAVRDPVTGIVSTAPQNDTRVRGLNVAPLLADVTTSDVDVLFLQPDKTSLSASQPVTIDLKVANLKQPIVGVNAYINFSSSQYIADATGTGAPQVQAGGGVWDTLIYRTWNVGGDLDVVIAVNLTAQVGTSADGTVGKITLTPTKTETVYQGGTTRVLFRADGTPTVAGGPTVLTYLEPATAGSPILPARVMTPAITIAEDKTGPVLSASTMTATQDQPHGGTVNVKAGTGTGRTQVVRTGGSGATASGPVVFKVPCSDAGVGLSGPPEMRLKQSGESDIIVPCTTPDLVSGNFLYEWIVPATIAQGTWSANVKATDRVGITTTVNGAFNLSVNTREVNGIVELQSFKGSTRMVTFKVGDSTGPNTSSIRQWDQNLNFTSGLLLDAGAFQNRAAMATRIQQAGDSLSTYLAYGDIVDLPALSLRLANQQGGVSMWIHYLLYGNINPVSTLAGKLTAPTRAVDSYIISRLSNDTILQLGAYVSAAASAKPALAGALIEALLHDFSTIVVGGSIYDPVRFASVTLSSQTWALLWVSNPTRAQLDALNRNLLQDAYSEYTAGQLDAGTAQRLAQYAGSNDPTLLSGLVKAFDTMTISPGMWPTATAPFGQCLYNEGVFLGVQLSAPTIALLTASPFPTGNGLTLLNQRLLEDAYAGLFVRAPLSPATVQAARSFNPASPAAFEAGMITDLNTLVGGGKSIYTAARFAPWAGAVDPNSELGLLLLKTNPTPAELVRMNRLLLELAYDTELSKGVLAEYRLVQVLDTSNEVTAKTAWNLRARQVIGFDSLLQATADFVSDGVAGWTNSKDYFLRGGDVTGDNAVTTADYNALRMLYGQTGSAGAPVDMNGDGLVNILDYSVLQGSWAKTGDADAQ